jgi:enterochelin esterase-like enzyme
VNGRVDQIPFESAALRGNRLGDPHVRSLFVYTPPGYGEDTARRYPTVLMLSSHGNTAQSMLNWRPYGESIQQQVDRLIMSGACPPHIMILPDTWTALGGTLHLDTPAMGNYGTYVIDEIIPYVDAHYRTMGSGDHRAVMGRSSGGYAALYHAMTRSGTFAAVADHSGDVYFPFMAIPDIARLHRNLAKFGGLDGFMADTKLNTPKDQSFFETIAILTFAATFAPNPDAPHGFDLPIDTETGALREDVWARCLDYDPLALVMNPEYAESLRGLKELFIDCGSYDEYNLQVGARLLSRALASMEIPHTFEEYPGGHRGTHYRYDVSLPRLVAAIS